MVMGQCPSDNGPTDRCISIFIVLDPLAATRRRRSRLLPWVRKDARSVMFGIWVECFFYSTLLSDLREITFLGKIISVNVGVER